MTSREEVSGSNIEQVVLESIANTMGTNVHTTTDDSFRTQTVVIGRDDEPINEFIENDRLIMTAFPTLFLLGQGIPCKSTINNKLARVLLLHFSHRFSRNPRFLFLLYNQKIRHDIARNISTQVKSNSKSMEAFKSVVTQHNFEETLKQCVACPQSKESKKIIKGLLPHIRFTGGNIPFSAIASKKNLSELYAMTSFFGPPLFFLTISPNDLGSKLIIRFACGDNIHETEQCLVDANRRAKILVDNPIFASHVFYRLLHAVMTYFTNLRPSVHTRKNHPPVCDRLTSVIGKTVVSFFLFFKKNIFIPL